MTGFAEAVGSWRVALRMAVREAGRRKARALLVVGMLAMPVYAGTVLALSYRYTYASADTEASWALGQAHYRVDGSDLDRVAATLPAGSRTTPVVHGKTIVRAGDRYTLQEYEAVDAADPLTKGMYVIRDGRAARGATEVAVSSRLAAALSVRVGDTLSAGLPPRNRTVVGVVDIARELSYPTLITAADQPLSANGSHALLVKLPGGAGWTPQASRQFNLGWMDRADVKPSAAEQATRAAALMLVVGFAGVQVALLAGAAFAVGARRQRRELAMIGAVGASRSQLGRLVLGNGLILGAVAGLLGVGSGVLTFAGSRDLVEETLNHPLAAAGAPVMWLAGIGLFAVVVGVLAALGPARGVAHQSIMAALAGREPVSRASNLRWLTGGLLVAAGGATAATVASGTSGSLVTVTAGAVAVLLGIAALAPVLVSVLGRIAPKLPLSMRLAVRHAARHRLRTAASVAAVCAAVAGSMALMLFNAAKNNTAVFAQPKAHPGQVLMGAAAAERLTPDRLQAIGRTLPTRSAVPFGALSWTAGVRFDEASRYRNSGLPPDPSRLVAVGGAALIRAVTGNEAPPTAVEALHQGGAVVFYPELLHDSTVDLNPPEGSANARAILPATLIQAPDYYTKLPGVVISEQTAARYHLPVLPGGVVFDTTRIPTTAELAAANSVTLELFLDPGAGATAAALTVGATPSPAGRDYGAMFLILSVVSAAVTLAASAVAVGLATAEMRNDLSTLAAVGAEPRLRRRMAAAQAGLIVGLGALLGTIAGIAPAAGMVAFRRDLVWQIPWLPLVLTVLIAPVLAVTATALLTRPRLILVRRLT
jgi:putative ABC transport system permease protein